MAREPEPRSETRSQRNTRSDFLLRVFFVDGRITLEQGLRFDAVRREWADWAAARIR